MSAMQGQLTRAMSMLTPNAQQEVYKLSTAGVNRPGEKQAGVGALEGSGGWFFQAAAPARQ